MRRLRRALLVIIATLLLLAGVFLWLTSPNAEATRATEQQDIAAIVQGVLAIQEHDAAKQHRPLARGTHAKGVCTRATFEVYDLASTIRDLELSVRLAKGIYAKPAVHQAMVRFANADSNVNADSKRDVRAMSFSIETAGDGASDAPARQDFSTNDRPTFPINDAHAFATLVRVVGAPTPARGIRDLPFADKLSFARTAILGQGQELQSELPYQKRRYWSTVPFKHGPTDVIKYSATPCAGNPGGDLERSDPNALQNELVRHLDRDATMACFDFGLQFLNTDAMTYWGRRRSRDFWIENASVEWKESEAPFHTVGRLTLLPKSQVPAEACEAWHIDVTEHSAPDSAPLGSINRARKPAELASRKARLKQ
jgi:Catalase